MEIHTIILAFVAALSLPLFAAYWWAVHRSTQAHLEVLCASDDGEKNSDLRPWKRLEKAKMGIALGFLLLLVAWGIVQCYLGDHKSALDWVFTWSFAPAYVAFALVGEHYNYKDLFNSMGMGQRAERRHALSLQS